MGAGVSEALLFRHFGTKATLFEHAVVEPFTRYLDDYLVRWTRAADSEAGVEELTGDYLGGLFDLFREHRELVVALVAAYAHEDQFSEVLSEALSGALSRNSAFAAQEARRRGYALYDAELTPRVFLATVVGMAVIDGWLAPASQPAHSRDDIVQEMTSILVQGIDGREKRHT
ncbi:MAG: hypothetical protein QOH68_4268 [Nocardioidaceae bacterium]|nr:hypothetical protein [Nocardioidaceae bacterium]